MPHDGRHAWLRLTPDTVVSWDFRKLGGRTPPSRSPPFGPSRNPPPARPLSPPPRPVPRRSAPHRPPSAPRPPPGWRAAVGVGAPDRVHVPAHPLPHGTVTTPVGHRVAARAAARRTTPSPAATRPSWVWVSAAPWPTIRGSMPLERSVNISHSWQNSPSAQVIHSSSANSARSTSAAAGQRMVRPASRRRRGRPGCGALTRPSGSGIGLLYQSRTTARSRSPRTTPRDAVAPASSSVERTAVAGCAGAQRGEHDGEQPAGGGRERREPQLARPPGRAAPPDRPGPAPPGRGSGRRGRRAAAPRP